MLRETVLTAIKEKQGQWVSGEALSQELGVSRTAVWKQIKALQAEGYAVESSPKKGYRLSALPDILSAAEVRPGLQTAVFGREHYFYFTAIDSTNNYARQLAAENYPEGTVVVAEQQTAGRGRRGRVWDSQPGQGIYMSMILRPGLQLNQLSRVTPSIAVAIAETLQKCLKLTPGIKWPNDVFVRGRKIAGILTEAVTDMDGIEYIVIGIGLNVNNRVGNFPEEFRHTATSACEEVQGPVSRVDLLQELLLQLETYCRQMNGVEFAPILEKYRELSVVIGRDIKMDSSGGAAAGRAIDIDSNGFLMVRDTMGNIHHVMSGEIFLKEPSGNAR